MSEIAYLDICCFKRQDDQLLKIARRHREQLRVEVVVPDQVPLETGGDHV